MCYPFLRGIEPTFLTIFVGCSSMNMDFDFPTSVYTLAVVAYTIYSWTKKGNKSKGKRSETSVDQMPEAPTSKPMNKETEPQLPDWLKELIDESTTSNPRPDSVRPVDENKPMTNPTAADPVRQAPEHYYSRKNRTKTQPVARHRDSQETLESDRSSLEKIDQELNSLEEIESAYKVNRGGTNPSPSQNKMGKTDNTKSHPNAADEPSEFLPKADLRKAIIWSEILKPHPEQART